MRLPPPSALPSAFTKHTSRHQAHTPTTPSSSFPHKQVAIKELNLAPRTSELERSMFVKEVRV